MNFAHTPHTHVCTCVYIYIGFPGGSLVKNPPPLACQCKSHRFNPWLGNIPWKRKWQSTSVFLPGKSHGQRSRMGYSLWGCKKIRHDLGLNNNIHTFIHIAMCVMLQGMWDLSSPPEITLLLPALEVCRYNHWTARKVQSFIYIYIYF